ncbi:hypothetical protein CWB99_13130 [Pseudoalteromonas rubra]|uniref:Uncharacterized protein n=1 Tax=Pseudoalteromonas rubra TaxID=43658 RepID=A0A5S3WLD5_9GAMM|nr:hypothetical protein [Pseudoalteromonas rubra]TMP27859.1 hypothetical protein CWB99_13130 [Pseudoalteromonas rubra]TMP31180.1 hypothetical protein CWC00_15160 [Pseudoalteromonas rubra]
MRNYLLLSTFGVLAACGGSSNNDNKSPSTDNRQQIVNQAPSVSLEGNTLVNSGDILSLTATVSDPENDSVTGVWSSSLAGVQFIDTTNGAHHVIFPDVDEQTQVTLTYTVTDSHNNQVSKTWQVTVMPKSAAGHIELADTLTLTGGGLASVTATFTMTSKIEKVDWRSDGFELTNTDIQSNHDTRAGQSTFSIELPEVTQTQQFDIIFEITTSDEIISKTIKVTLTPESEPSLSVSLPEQVIVNEKNLLTIQATTTSTDEIISYEWQWQGTPQPSQQTQGKGAYTFSAPEVSEDQTFTLQLTVTMKGDIKKTAETSVVVRNITDLQGLELTMDRSFAVPGQTITVNSNLTNFDDVESVSWIIPEFGDDLLEKSNNKLVITIPEEDTIQTSRQIEYKVKLKNGTEQSTFVNFTYVSSTVAKTLMIVRDPGEFSIYPDVPATLDLTFNGGVDIEEVIVSSSDYDHYDNLQWSLEDQRLTLNLHKKTITRKGLTVIKITAKAGDIVRESTILGTAHSAIIIPYAGVEETYIMGSEAQVFGQVFHLDGKHNMPSHWQAKSTDDNVTIKQVSDTSASIRYNSELERIVTLEFHATDEHDQTDHSDVKLRYESNHTFRGDDYVCKVTDGKFESCRETLGQTLNLDAPAELKQVITKGDYACLLGNYGTVVCNAKGDNPVKNVPAQLLAAKLNAVDANNVCAQLSDASWQCWGSRGTELTDLLAANATVHKVLANGSLTCLVSNKDIKCYDGDTQTKLIEDVLPQDLFIYIREICYRTSRGVLKCDIE